MNTNKQDLTISLDELAVLINQLKEKYAQNRPDNDKQAFLENFERIIDDYKSLKVIIPEEFVIKFGNPIRKMALELIDLLKTELGYTEPLSAQLSNIVRIDQMLQDPKISMDEMNRLLDRRSEIKSI